jgi:two-component system, OmpR family, response regulator
MTRLLVVEDDARLAALLQRGLGRQGYDIDVVGATDTARAAVLDGAYDAIVCDVMLPGEESGMDWCRWLRGLGIWTPVLMLTARTGVHDRIAGLDAGADDYLGKPFAFGELSARIHALLRRTLEPRTTSFQLGALTLDVIRHEVRVDGGVVDLTPREFAVLEYLLRRQGEAVSRSEILDHVWDFAYDRGSNVVDVNVATLRRKLRSHGAGRLITTVRGVGYRADGESSA